MSMECCGGGAGGQNREGDGGEDGLIAIYTPRWLLTVRVTLDLNAKRRVMDL